MSEAETGRVSPDGLWRWNGASWIPTAERAAPQPLPAWASLTLRAPATWRMFVATLLVGLAADQALRTGTFGVGTSLTVALIAFAVVFSGLPTTLTSRLLAAAGLAFAAWLSLRASPWLLWPDLGAALVLLGLSASLAARGTLLDMGAAEAAGRAIHAVINGVAGSAFVLRPLFRSRPRLAAAAPIARGVLIAAPIAIVLAVLLAAADPVFASFFNLNIDFGQLTIDVLFVIGGGLVAAGLLRLAAADPIERIDGPRWRLGAVEGLVVLVILDAIFAAFAVAQAVAAAGAAAGPLQSAGVTYSDYARSGFFQLLWVAGITAVVIILFSRITSLSDARSRRSFVLLAEIAIGLTLLIVFVAFRRLSLYEEAFGFTMLRLYSHIFAVWIAVVFLLLAADIAGVFRKRRWFVGATITSAAVVLLALNFANPEAIVVALNIDHARTTHKIDAEYLGQLSSDATPSLLAGSSELDATISRQVAPVACAGPHSYAPQPAAYNVADSNAAAARRQDC